MSLINQLLVRLSANNSPCPEQYCQMYPAVQRQINEAGVLRVTPKPDVKTLIESAALLKEQSIFGDRALVRFFCFVPIKNDGNVEYNVYGVDNERKVIVVFERYKKSIQYNDQTVDYPFLVHNE